MCLNPKGYICNLTELTDLGNISLEYGVLVSMPLSSNSKKQGGWGNIVQTAPEDSDSHAFYFI